MSFYRVVLILERRAQNPSLYIDGGLDDKLLKLRIPIPINSTCERHYTKQSTVPAKQRIQKISKIMNVFVEHRFLNPFSGKLPLLHKISGPF